MLRSMIKLMDGSLMMTFYNQEHSGHAGAREMFRGELVPCFGMPSRVECVREELDRRQSVAGG